MNHAKDFILVAGGAGYIGGHVVRLLRRHGYQVVILDNFSNSKRNMIPDEVSLVEGSKGDCDLLLRTIDKYKPVGVLDLAGSIDIWGKEITHSEYYENNVVETARFTQALVSAGVTKFVFSSSATVYGVVSNEPVLESHSREPISIYGRTKRACEDIVCDVLGGADRQYVILRYYNVAGAMDDLTYGQYMPNFYHVIAAALNVAFGEVEQLNAYGSDFDTPDGTGIMDYIHVQDLADIHIKALIKLFEGDDSDIVNCGYGHGHSVLEVVDAVSRITDKPIPTNFLPRRGNFGGMSTTNNNKLIHEWGWQPKYNDLDSIVKHAYLWRKHLMDKT